MSRVNLRYLTFFAVAASFILTAEAVNATTIASFADPGTGGSVVGMFDIRDTGTNVGRIKMVNAGGTAVNLQVAGTPYNGAILTFDEIEYHNGYKNGTLDAGEFDFHYSGNLILKITFDSGDVSIRGMGGDNIFSGSNVQFSGPAVTLTGPLTEESFSFAFANQKPIKSGAQTIGFTSTAAFTSSAVPDPATIFLLALGSVFMAISRRR